MPFSQQKAKHALNFFHKVLNVKLPPWQQKCISDVFGTLRPDGRRQYRTIYIEVPGRNGKSVLLGGLGIYLALYGGEEHNQVTVAAATKNQTKNIFDVSLNYVTQSPILRTILKPLAATKWIQKRNDLLSYFRAISADGGKNDGFGGHVLVDELHRWHAESQLALWEVIKKAGTTLKEPLRVIITTAGSADESPLALSMHNRAMAILEGKIQDPTFYPLVFGLGPEDDFQDESNWVKVNPSLKENGGYMDIEALREIYRAALGDPVAERSFRRFHLNTWLSSVVEGAIELADWKLCSEALRGDRKERPCFLAIDLSSRLDLSALSAVWPDYDTGTFDVETWSWLPSEMLPKAGQRDKVPYEKWHKHGHLLTCEGRVIRTDDILAKVKELSEQYEVQEIAVDRWGMDELTARLEKDGFTVIPIPQNISGMTQPTKRFLELVRDAKLRHGGHPLLQWSASCLDLKTDHSGNIQPAKPAYNKSDKRIDPIVATIMALDRAIRHGYDNPDPYADGHDVVMVDY